MAIFQMRRLRDKEFASWDRDVTAGKKQARIWNQEPVFLQPGHTASSFFTNIKSHNSYELCPIIAGHAADLWPNQSN